MKKIKFLNQQQKKELTIDDALNLFKGQGGGPESESILNDSNSDKRNNSVFFWSNKADAAKVIERCRESIKSFKIIGDGIQLEIDRSAFRGMPYAFRTVKRKNKS